MSVELTPQRVIEMGKKWEELFLKGISVEERLAGLKPEERLSGLKPEEVFRNYTPEEVLRNYTPEEIERYLRTLKERDSGSDEER